MLNIRDGNVNKALKLRESRYKKNTRHIRAVQCNKLENHVFKTQ